MEKTLQTYLNDKAWARWTALILVSFTMMCGYFMTDVMAPLEKILTTPVAEGGLGWTGTEYGIFTGGYGWINVFLLMLFFGGLILDKLGVRLTGVGACLFMLVGACIKAWAISTPSILPTDTILGFNARAIWAGFGFAVFGVGAEVAGITVTKAIVRWFTGHEMALAMGLQVAFARIGTACALAFSAQIYSRWHDTEWPVIGSMNFGTSVAFGACLLCIGLIFYLVFCVMDKKLESSMPSKADSASADDEGFKLSDIKLLIGSQGFWLIALLCLTFYSGVFPFLKAATKFMECKFGVDPELAGYIPALLPFGTIILTPVFGFIYDRLGRCAQLMLIGSCLLTLVHLLFALPFITNAALAIVIMIVLGIAFSLVPSAMWPSVPKIIPQKVLGSAYALIFYIQNIGLMCVPMLIGWVVENVAKQPDGTYDYTVPMLIFTAFGVVAVGLSLMLIRVNRKHGYGLEKPNIKESK
jgi:nitrate/nitrite transporter NarK